MFGKKQKEIERLQARVAELEKEIAEFADDEYGTGPDGLDHLFNDSPRSSRKHGIEPEMSAADYAATVLVPLGYKFVDSQPDSVKTQAGYRTLA